MNIENALYDFIVSNNIATEEEINLVTSIHGYNEEELYSIIYARTGYNSYEQLPDDGYQGTDELNEYYDINKVH